MGLFPEIAKDFPECGAYCYPALVELLEALAHEPSFSSDLAKNLCKFAEIGPGGSGHVANALHLISQIFGLHSEGQEDLSGLCNIAKLKRCLGRKIE